MPARVVSIEGMEAVVDFGEGVKRRVLLGASDVRPGDLVVVHAGVVIGKVKLREALAMLDAYVELSVEMAVEDGVPRSVAEREVRERVERIKQALGAR